MSQKHPVCMTCSAGTRRSDSRQTAKYHLQLKHVTFWFLHITKIPYIVTHKIINPNQSEEHKEIYYYQLLKLFKPWQTKLNLSFPGLTYHKAYMKESVSLPDMVEHHNNNIQTSAQDEKLDRQLSKKELSNWSLTNKEHSLDVLLTISNVLCMTSLMLQHTKTR